MNLWLYDFAHYRKETLVRKLQWCFHVIIFVVGLFITFGGSYAMIKTIADEYATGKVQSAFSCADK